MRFEADSCNDRSGNSGLPDAALLRALTGIISLDREGTRGLQITDHGVQAVAGEADHAGAMAEAVAVEEVEGDRSEINIT